MGFTSPPAVHCAILCALQGIVYATDSTACTLGTRLTVKAKGRLDPCLTSYRSLLPSWLPPIIAVVHGYPLKHRESRVKLNVASSSLPIYLEFLQQPHSLSLANNGSTTTNLTANIPVYAMQRGNSRIAFLATDEDYASYTGWLTEYAYICHVDVTVR